MYRLNDILIKLTVSAWKTKKKKEKIFENINYIIAIESRK